jgi:hypothetical protein
LNAEVRVRVTDSGAPSLSGLSNTAGFAIQRAAGDRAGPEVLAGSTRVSPNPVNTRQDAILTAMLSDSTSGGGQVSAAEWSFGDTAAAAGTGNAMTGAFNAMGVAVSATIAMGTLPSGTQLLHVRGRDSAGNWGRASTLSVVVNDPVTATLLSLFQAEPVADGIEVRWLFGDPQMFASADLERAEARPGPWGKVEVERREEQGATVAVDRTAVAGSTYYYRLVATTRNGEVMFFGPLSATVGRAITEFALVSVTPNPTAGLARIEFTLPREARVRLSVVDIQGREVAMLADAPYRAGRYQATWSGKTGRDGAAAGVYFVRYQVPGRSQVRRVVVAR